MENENFVYEDAMNELSTIISKLQNGNVSLDESLELYTRGVKLASLCDAKIKEVEQKIAMVNNDGTESEFDSSKGEIG